MITSDFSHAPKFAQGTHVLRGDPLPYPFAPSTRIGLVEGPTHAVDTRIHGVLLLFRAPATSRSGTPEST